MSSHTGHGESTLLPLPGRILLPCTLVQSVGKWPYLGIIMGILSYSALSLIPLWAQSPWGYLGFWFSSKDPGLTSPFVWALPKSVPWQNTFPFLFLSGRNLNYAISQVTYGIDYNLMLRLAWLRSWCLMGVWNLEIFSLSNQNHLKTTVSHAHTHNLNWYSKLRGNVIMLASNCFSSEGLQHTDSTARNLQCVMNGEWKTPYFAFSKTPCILHKNIKWKKRELE